MKKILYLTFIVLITIAFTGSVYSYFFDQENSYENNFTASTLYFSLVDFSNEPITNPLFNISGLTPGENQAKNIRIKKSGLEDFKYKIYYSEISGDDAFCEALQIEAKLEGVSKYSGDLPDFLVNPQTISASGEDDWEFKVVLNDSNAEHTNKNCSFKIFFKAWQVDSDGTWGFIDEINMDNYFISGTWENLTSPQSDTNNESSVQSFNSGPQNLEESLVPTEPTPSSEPESGTTTPTETTDTQENTESSPPETTNENPVAPIEALP